MRILFNEKISQCENYVGWGAGLKILFFFHDFCSNLLKTSANKKLFEVGAHLYPSFNAFPCTCLYFNYFSYIHTCMDTQIITMEKLYNKLWKIVHVYMK